MSDPQEPPTSRFRVTAGIVLVLGVAGLLTVPDPSRADDVWDVVFPEAQMRDAGSLDLDLGPPQRGETDALPRRAYQRRSVEFTSFVLGDETWRLGGEILVPENRSEDMRGKAAIVSSFGRRARSSRYAEIAISLGIPVLLIQEGNPGPRYGVETEGSVMAYGLRRTLRTGDPRWHGYAWLGKNIVRAVTALAASLGEPLFEVVVTGCSKRGAASYIAAAADSRIVGALPTCVAAGPADRILQEKARRWGLDFVPEPGVETDAPAFVSTRRQLLAFRWFEEFGIAPLHDATTYPERLAGRKLLFVKGTNDPLIPPFGDAAALALLPRGTRILNVPNLGHTSDSEWHFEAWRMWLAHVLWGRPVPDPITEIRADSRGLRVRAAVDARSNVQSAVLWWASDERGAYIDAEWRSVAMSPAAAGTYEALLHPGESDYTMAFVEIRDFDPATGTAGLVTSIPLEHRGRRAAPLPTAVEPTDGMGLWERFVLWLQGLAIRIMRLFG